MSAATVRAAAWDDALLTLIYERGPLSGEDLLAVVIEEATNAIARLQERGMIEDAS